VLTVVVAMQGDAVRLVRAVDENWYEGHLGGRHGIFPASYVETLVAPDSAMMTPMTSRSGTPMPGLLQPVVAVVAGLFFCRSYAASYTAVLSPVSHIGLVSQFLSDFFLLLFHGRMFGD